MSSPNTTDAHQIRWDLCTEAMGYIVMIRSYTTSEALRRNAVAALAEIVGKLEEMK